MVERKILLNPGPATTTDSVKNSQVVPDICPREKEFGDLMKSISEDLVKISGGPKDYGCVLFGGSGTAAMESVISSVVHGKVLIINNGAYGKRMIEIAKRYSIDFKEIFFDWNEKVDLEKVREELDKDEEVGYVAMVHHETTTGILNPIKKIGEVVKEHNCVFIVDTISSFAGVDFDVKDCNIDFMFSTSNKCIQGMAGISFVICKLKELEKIKGFKKRNLYLDLYDQYKYFEENEQMRFTAPVQTVYALRKAIDEFFKEGAENRFKRYREMNEILVKGMVEIGFKKALEGVEESGLLTMFFEPENENYDFEKMHDLLYEKGFTIYPGKIKENTFRLANMGAIEKEDIEKFLKAVVDALKEMGVEL